MKLNPALLYILAASLCGLTYACVTEYQPEAKTLPSALIVDGSITDQPGPYTIKLTRTANYQQNNLNLLETKASVVIADNTGQQEILTETSLGTYQTKAGGLQGTAGRSYRITIATKDGNRYESTPELLTAAPPIGKLYAEYRADPTALTNVNIQGWDVYLDTKDPAAAGDYYRWEWMHYEPISVCQVMDRLNMLPLATSCCTPCWDITRCYSCLNIKSDASINGNTLSRQLITRVPFTGRTPYYIEVKQHRLSAGGFAFWQSVKGLIQQNGGLFDAAPSTVRGNLRCTNKADVAVYGFFGAAGVAESYLYVDRSNAQGQPPFVQYEYAVLGCAVCADNGQRTPVKPRWWQN